MDNNRSDTKDKKAYSGSKRPRRDSYDDMDDKSFQRMGSRRKMNAFYADPDFILDYKDIKLLQTFLSEHGKIVPRRMSGLSAKDQRKLTTAIKRARHLALVGYTSL